MKPEILPIEDYKTITDLYLEECNKLVNERFLKSIKDYSSIVALIEHIGPFGVKGAVVAEIILKDKLPKFFKKFKRLTNTILRAQINSENTIVFTLEVV